MATRTEGTDYKSRFDLQSHANSDEPATGTLKELLAEINYEYRPASGVEIELEGLGGTLKFIRRFTSHEFNSINEPLPVQVLKTIKLLHVTNDESAGQMFRWLEIPGTEEKPSFEVRTTGEPTRNGYMVKILNDLLHSLEHEISAERLQRIERSLLTTAKLLQCIQGENREILFPFNGISKNDDDSKIRALNFLAESIRSYSKRRFQSKAPLHEALYTYLRTLPFHHFVGEYREVIETARIDTPTHSIRRELKALCDDLSDQLGEPIASDTTVTSIDQFPLFVEENATTLRKLVKAAIDLDIRNDALPDVIPLAIKVLHSHVFHEWGETPLHATNLSAADCVAALCTIRHQQMVKTRYVPFWIGQGSKDRNRNRLLSHLDPERRIEDLYKEDYIPEGASQLLYDRFRQFHAIIEGRMELHQAWMGFHMARLDGYIRSLQFTDIDCIDTAVNDLNAYCELMAIQAVRSLHQQ